jgi:heat shock protein HslJ
VLPGTPITLEFRADGQAGDTSGCNSHGGTCQVLDKTLIFRQVVSTLRACADDKLNQHAQGHLTALQTVVQFERTGDHLAIRYDNRRSVLNLAVAAAATSTPARATPTAVLVFHHACTHRLRTLSPRAAR